MSYGLLQGARRSVRGRKGAKVSAALNDAKDWEIDRSTLTGLKEIGQGQFGVVYIGNAANIIPGEVTSQVAIKTLSAEGAEARADFDAEAKIMKTLSQCPKIVRLLGLCTEDTPSVLCNSSRTMCNFSSFVLLLDADHNLSTFLQVLYGDGISQQRGSERCFSRIKA